MQPNQINDEKLLSMFAYLLGPFSGIGLLFYEKSNRLIRFHAMQSTLVFGAMILLSIVLNIVPLLHKFINYFIYYLFNILAFVLWMFLMYKAYLGERYKLPYFGDLAEKQLEKLG